MMEDDQLMIGIQSGDSRAFEKLVETHQGALLGFFIKNTRDPQLAEDLSQETLLRVYNQAWDYLPMGRFRGWMFRIARNLLIDNVRRRSHDALVSAITGKAEDESDSIARLTAEILPASEIADQNEIAQLVDEMLDQIPEEQRLTFTLHHFAGLTLSEVAEALETSLPTSKSRLRLAREKLRLMLGKLGIKPPSTSATS
jgi:RNA polymerase sigma-70 factor (ECF subfamily)